MSFKTEGDCWKNELGHCSGIFTEYRYAISTYCMVVISREVIFSSYISKMSSKGVKLDWHKRDLK